MDRAQKREAARCGVRGSLLVSGFVAIASALCGTARADCEPSPPASGDTVTCTGNPPGYSVSGLGSLTVDILQGTNLNGPFFASDIGILSVDNSGNLQQVTLENNGSVDFISRSNINSGLEIIGDGDHRVTNVSGSNINSFFTFSGDGNNSVINEGTLNPGITVTGNGTMDILNKAGAFVNQGIIVTGATDTSIDNYGTIQGTAISLDSGRDQITNRAGANINGEVNQGSNDDDFLMEGGTVNGNIQQGAGSDTATIEGGQISGYLRAGTGTDSLLWTGGLVGGIDMEQDDDEALFIGLTDAELRTIEINGGLGYDVLTWQGVVGSRPDRLLNWELIQLRSGSELTMGGSLVLGDSGTQTGRLTIDGSSTLHASEGQYTIDPAVSGNGVVVVNAGTIDMTSSGDSVTDVLTIDGDYVGQGGTLLLDTYLFEDGAPSDKLVVTGNESGTTTIIVTNVGGPGGLTSGDGILVDEDIDGISTGGAFALGGVAAAGPYEYLLFRSGVTEGTENNWYLRSHIEDPDGEGDGDGSGSHEPDGGSSSSSSGSGSSSGASSSSGSSSSSSGGSGSSGGASSSSSSTSSSSGGGQAGGGGEIIPLYRPEVSVHVTMPALSRALTLATLGTYHEREGEQAWSRRGEGLDSVWLRAFGSHFKQSWGGSVDPKFDGDLWGMQVGVPLYATDTKSGRSHTAGLMLGGGRASGDTRGFAIAVENADTGDVSLDSYNIGGYWTHHWADGGYLDGVLLLSSFDGDSRSNRAVKADIDGEELALSLEGGRPFPLDGFWSLEPQAQLVWQYQDLDNTKDPYSSIRFGHIDALTARVGGRLVGDIVRGTSVWRPYIKANIWHEVHGKDAVMFNRTAIYAERGFTTLEAGVGLTADLGGSTSLFGVLDYSTDLDSEEYDSVEVRFGFRKRW